MQVSKATPTALTCKTIKNTTTVGKEASNEGSFHLSPLLAAPSLAALYICSSEGQMEESKALHLHTAWPAGVKG